MARSILNSVYDRDDDVSGWVYLDEDLVMNNARALDLVPLGERGVLHGLPVAIKDVIYTKGEFDSLININMDV